MKKLAYSLVVALAAFACTKEAAVEEPEAPQETRMTFSATFEEDDALTKTSLGDSKTIVWDEGDDISVFDFNSSATPVNAQCILKSGAGTANATFDGEVAESKKGYFAVYPYQDGLEYVCSDAEYPTGLMGFLKKNYSIQYARKGNIPAGIPMVAYAEAPSDGSMHAAFSFKNVFSYIKFTTDYACKSVSITSNNPSECISPSYFNVYFDDSGVPVVSNYGTGLTSSKTITLVDEDGDVLEPGTYYVAVLPQTLSEGFTMTFTSATDETKTAIRTSDKENIELKRSSILNLGVIDLYEIADIKGSGTESDPYLISNFAELRLMSHNVNSGEGNWGSAYYKQIAKVDAQWQTIEPISGAERFSGTYDGNGETIENIYYSKSSFDGMNVYALFGCIKGATIKNLKIHTPGVKLEADGYCTVSPLVGVALSDKTVNHITNCLVSYGSSSYSEWEIKDCGDIYYGGFVAFNESEIVIEHCSSTIRVKFVPYNPSIRNTHSFCGGGILGYTSGRRSDKPSVDDANNDAPVYVKYCRNSGKMTVNCIAFTTNLILGGIIGKCYDSNTLGGDVCVNVSYCVNSGNLEIVNDSIDNLHNKYVGGIIGYNDSDGYGTIFTEIHNPSIYQCLNSGDMEDTHPVYLASGGIMSKCYDEDTSVKYCVNTGFSNATLGCSMYGFIDLSNDHEWNCTSCFSTHSYTYNEGCTVKEDLTPEYMNALMPASSEVKWKKGFGTNPLDLDI